MSRRGLTKKARKERAQALIDENRIDLPFSEEHVAAMNEILGVDFLGYVRRANPDFPTDPRHVHALSAEGWRAFSWNKAISPVTPEQNAKRVMRETVRELMREYRDTQEPVCAHCGAIEDLTVDHTPPFDTIADQFLSAFGVPEVVSTPCGGGNMFADIDLEAEWIAFHQSRITLLKILCRPCNSSKGKRDTVKRVPASKEQE